jgi:S1-C subfamily serine protease
LKLGEKLDLASFADMNLGQQYQPLVNIGPYSNSIHDFLKHEKYTAPYVATIFWQSFTSSPAFAKTLYEAGASPAAISRGENFIVQHGNGSRFDLIVFDPFLQSSNLLKVESVNVSMEELDKGRVLFEQRKQRLNIAPEPLGDYFKVAMEANSSAKFGIIIVPQEQLEFTSVVPRPAIPTSCISGNATAGVFTTDSEGRLGVTTALHAIGNNKTVNCGNVMGDVISIDPITDSCFIEFSGPSVQTGQIVKGPLTGRTPGVGEVVNFEGARSGFVTTRVIGWSPELPLVVEGSQLKILTQAVTQPGDSGAALFDENRNILGFAFYRTGYKALVEFSAWIWAESVFTAHNLK